MSFKRVLLITTPLLAIACADLSSGGVADESSLVQLDPALEKAALANLKRISRELDVQHLANYATLPANTDPTFGDVVAKAFLDAVKLEYEAKPELLKKRVQTLASMVFFSAPEVATDANVGRVTPFHGMNDAAFNALMRNEDFVFGNHMAANSNSPNGVRPFSVCETKYMIQISTGKIADPAFVSGAAINNYDAYAKAYSAFASTCAQADLDQWYNFRGLGGLRPSWLESNYNDRVLRKMLKTCKAPTEATKALCATFQADRLAYRDKKNVAMALREMVWDTTPTSMIAGKQDGDYLVNSNNPGIFLEDRNGDNVAEWLPSGPAQLLAGAKITLADKTQVTVGADGKTITKADGTSVGLNAATVAFVSQAQFGATVNVTLALADNTSTSGTAPTGAFQPISRVDTRWKPEFATRKDLGLQELFSDGAGCAGDVANPATCPIQKRFYSMIDRHENFYQTYSSLDGASANISSQPSPLVACSVTLQAAHAWDTAGTPAGGSAGFIYLMRIPFNEILTGDSRSIDTLGRLKGGLKSGPSVLKLADVTSGKASLDMTKVWLDIATLSSNQYASEHEISKFGTVPAEQIEGVLVIRKPAAMGPPVVPPQPPGGGGPDVNPGNGQPGGPPPFIGDCGNGPC
jgi:hypothetical protein